MAYQLNFDINASGAQQLDRIAAAVAEIGKRTNATAGELKILEQVLRADAAAGKALEDSLQDIAKSAGSFGKGIADAAKSLSSMDDQTVKVSESVKVAAKDVDGLTKELDKLVRGAALGAAGMGAMGGIGLQIGRLLGREVADYVSRLSEEFKILAHDTNDYSATLSPLVDASNRAKKATEDLDASLVQLKASIRSLQEENLTAVLGNVAGSANKATNAAMLDVPTAEYNLALIQRRLQEAEQQKQEGEAAAVAGRNLKTGKSYTTKYIQTINEKEVQQLQDQESIAYKQLEEARLRALNKQIQAAQAQEAETQAKADAAKAAAEKAQRERTTVQQKFSEFGKRMNEREMTPVERIYYERDQLLKLNSTAAQRDQATIDANTGAAAALAKEQQAQRKLSFQLDAGNQAVYSGILPGGAYSDEIKEGTQDLQRLVRMLLKDLKEISSEYDQSAQIRIGGLQRQGNRQAQIAGTVIDNPVELAQAQYAIALQQIAAEQKIAETINDEKKQKAELARLEENRIDAALRYQLVIAETAKKERDEFANLAVGLVNAGFGGSKGITAFFEGQARSLLDTVVRNGAKDFIWPAIKNSIPHAATDSTLGKLLAGTPFAPKNDGSSADQALWVRMVGLAGTAGGGTTQQGAQTVVGALAKAAGIDLSAITGSGSSGSAAIPDYQPGEYGSPATVNGQPISNNATGVNYGGAIAGGASLLFGGYQAYNQFSRGGARGDIAGVGAASGAVAGGLSAASALGLVGSLGSTIPILGAVAAVLPIISSLFGDPKQDRQNQINKEITQGKYFAPVALNVSQDGAGNYVDVDRYGQARGSSLSAIPQVLEPYLHKYGSSYYDVPGRVTSQFGGGAAPQVTQVTIQAIDSKSLADTLKIPANAAAVAGGIDEHLKSAMSSPLQRTLKRQLA